jgi:hypothetical protein
MASDIEKKVDAALAQVDYFGKDQIRQFVKQVKDKVGYGWKLLGPDLQRALIAEKAVSVLIGQRRGSSIPQEAVRQLYVDMCRVAGVLEFEE